MGSFAAIFSELLMSSANRPSELDRQGPATAMLRHDLQVIAKWIPENSKVLDLGCGEGELLAWLQRHKACWGYGAEIDHKNVMACLEKGVNVIQTNIDDGLSLFSQNEFDVVVLSQALQATHETEMVLQDMRQLGKRCIVSIPNFGHWSHIVSLAKGFMPVNARLPYQWYDTPNHHFATTQDFEGLLCKLGFTIHQQAYLAESHDGSMVEIKQWPNLRCTLALYSFQ